MPTYISLIKWTDQGRANVDTLPDRAAEVADKLSQAGIELVGHWMTMGHYDQVAVMEAPSDEVAAKALVLIAGRGNVVTETLRGFSMDELRDLQSG